MMRAIVRLAFWRCRAYSRRDRALAWTFSHAWGWGRPGRAFRREVGRLGDERAR
jgi:hypothetical protein